MRRRRLAAVLSPAVLSLALAACGLPRWPVEAPLSSPFGLRLRGIRPEVHRGVDLAAPAGTPVRAMKAGRVEHAGPLGAYGLAVVLDHGGGLVTLYGHLSQVSVRAGERVDGGAVVGQVGSTGNATGAHLHFEVLRGGRPEDPVPLLGRRPG